MCDAQTMAAIAAMQQQIQMVMGQLGNIVGAMAKPSYVQQGSTWQPTNPWPTNPGTACGGQPYCAPDLVSPETAAAIKAGPRTLDSTVPVGGLAPGATTTPTTIASNGLGRYVSFVDLIGSLGAGVDLDAVMFTVSVGGVVKFTFNGGRFSRSNANACASACGLGACLGPVEAITFTVTNQSAAAFAAGTFVKLTSHSAYQGEPGYNCPPCITPGTGAGVGSLPMV